MTYAPALPGFEDGDLAAFAEANAFLKFLFAGNSTFTVVSEKTGARYTYKVSVAKERPSMFFVKVLTGPDNVNDFTYIGFIDAAKGKNALRPGKKGNATHPAYQGLRWLITCALRPQGMPTTAKVYHEGRCGRCNRKLTTPESVEAGFGPECIGKV